jgi:hypothetical protein
MFIFNIFMIFMVWNIIFCSVMMCESQVYIFFMFFYCVITYIASNFENKKEYIKNKYVFDSS